MSSPREFIRNNFKHFNARSLAEMAEGYASFVSDGGKVLLALGGAMSTAEIGRSLAPLIREGFVHALSVTGANLEEDLFLLVGRDRYPKIVNPSLVSPTRDKELLERRCARVLDTAIPFEVMEEVGEILFSYWEKFDLEGQRVFPHEIFYAAIRDGHFDRYPGRECSWLVAAAEKDIPLVVPGWEDSTLGNSLVFVVRKNWISGYNFIKSGLEYMDFLVDWYVEESKHHPLGFFQIGGGIAGDFPICVVPLIRDELKIEAPMWKFFGQISDSVTSYGSYSGATPSEKISWGKLEADTPSFVVESDATIVFPLVASFLLGRWN